MLKEIFTFNNAGDFKGTEFRKYGMRGYILAKDEQAKNFNFWLFKKNALCVYGEYV
jgi:hypothetical protein